MLFLPVNIQQHLVKQKRKREEKKWKLLKV